MNLNGWQHPCQAATTPPVQALTIEYIYPDRSRKTTYIDEDVVTVCDVLAAVEQLLTINLDHGTSNDPYGSMANMQPVTERLPCQRQPNFFDHRRCQRGYAGLLKSESEEGLWEFRDRVTSRSRIISVHISIAYQPLFAASQ